MKPELFEEILQKGTEKEKWSFLKALTRRVVPLGRICNIPLHLSVNIIKLVTLFR